MRLGIECLLSEREDEAERIARELDTLNVERREIESGMQAQAAALLDGLDPTAPGAAVSLFREDWHHGVVGILAARVKDRLHRPVAAFAPDGDGEHIRGSVRSIPGVHVRDLLDTVAARKPPGSSSASAVTRWPRDSPSRAECSTVSAPRSRPRRTG